MSYTAIVRCWNGECHTRLANRTPPRESRDSVEISAAVGDGAPNRLDDVREIQNALNKVRPSDGGPMHQLKVDGLCYVKTLAAIRKFQREACGFKWPDGRIDPNGKTHNRLKYFFVPANPYVLPRVYLILPQASLWIQAAHRVLGNAQMHLGGMPGFSKQSALVNKYFHLDTLTRAQALASMSTIQSTFITMMTCIGHSSPLTTLGSGYFQEDPLDNQNYAYTSYGGFTRRSRTTTTPPMTRDDHYQGPNQRQDTIFVCPNTLRVHSDEFYTSTIVHELAHFCGPEIGSADKIADHSYRWRPNFFQLTAHLAVRTAECYSQFAGESKLGREPAGQ